MTIVYVTIWIAMVLFVAGESGRAFSPARVKPPRWAWWMFFTGWVVAVVHTFLAFAIAHNWSHADALHDTARLTREMYGVDFDQALYMNYVFLTVWLADAWWWAAAPQGYVRPTVATWIFRGFYIIYLFNAMVVFAQGWRRILGLLFVSWLARMWAPGVFQSRLRRV